jgi:hypothetical protein
MPDQTPDWGRFPEGPLREWLESLPPPAQGILSEQPDDLIERRHMESAEAEALGASYELPASLAGLSHTERMQALIRQGPEVKAEAERTRALQRSAALIEYDRAQQRSGLGAA